MVLPFAGSAAFVRIHVGDPFVAFCLQAWKTWQSGFCCKNWDFRETSPSSARHSAKPFQLPAAVRLAKKRSLKTLKKDHAVALKAGLINDSIDSRISIDGPSIGILLPGSLVVWPLNQRHDGPG